MSQSHHHDLPPDLPPRKRSWWEELRLWLEAIYLLLVPLPKPRSMSRWDWLGLYLKDLRHPLDWVRCEKMHLETLEELDSP